MLCLWVHWSHFCEENLDHFELVSRIRAAVLRLQQDGLKAGRSKHHGMIWDIYLDVAQYHGIWYVVVCCDMLWHWNEHNSETGIEIAHIEFRWIHVWFWIQLDFELTFTDCELWIESWCELNLSWNCALNTLLKSTWYVSDLILADLLLRLIWNPHFEFLQPSWTNWI
jgi:hypothetical protein